MKTIFKISALVAAFAVLFSCETYKVDDPDMTAIHKIDGKFMAFGTLAGESEPSTIFAITITNTTNDDSNAAWVTISDMNYGAFYPTTNWTRLLALRFRVNVNLADQSLSISNGTAEEPRTAWNPFVEGAYGSYGSYYTCQYQKGVSLDCVGVDFSGKIVTDGATTGSGSKADKIEFSYTIKYKDGSSDVYTAEGMKKTGWAEDADEYETWLVDNGLW